MTSFFFLERELLGAIRVRSATLLSLALVSLFLFLACFASLFLLPGSSTSQQGGMGSNAIVAYVSPRLATASINNLFLRLQERPDVRSVKFNLPEEVTSERTGGAFSLVARSPGAVAGLVEALRATDGITSVETTTGPGQIVLTGGARLGLLCGLAVCALLSLFLAREGFRALLQSFRSEIRLMRLSGVAERRILGAVIVTGLLIGFLAGLLLVVGLALYSLSAFGANSEVAVDVTRLVGVGVVSLLLGMLMGGLMGLLGSGHLASSRFSPIS
jgi:cell division protein FtsX